MKQIYFFLDPIFNWKSHWSRAALLVFALLFFTTTTTQAQQVPAADSLIVAEKGIKITYTALRQGEVTFTISHYGSHVLKVGEQFALLLPMKKGLRYDLLNMQSNGMQCVPAVGALFIPILTDNTVSFTCKMVPVTALQENSTNKFTVVVK
jgi:hypothetical protein